MIVDELVAVLGYDLRDRGELRRFQQSIDDTARKVGLFAAAAAAAFAALGKSVIGTSAQFESFQATLETVEGSSEKAKKSLDWISDFAKRTPYEVEELTRSFVKLRAYGMDPTSGLMEDLGNASSAMGKSLIDAVEMIADASMGEFERLKEFGIRASQAGDQVTFSWNENGKSLTKTVKKTGTEITKFIQERFGDRFAGAMLRQSKTWNGMMSNLSDSWTDFQRRIGDAGFFDFMKSRLKGLLDEIGRLDADGSLDRWAESISNGLTKAVKAASIVFDRLIKHFSFIADWISSHPDIWDKLKLGLMAVAGVIFPKTAALLVLEDILSWMQGADSVIGDFAAALEELTGVDADKLDHLIAILGGSAAVLAAAVGPINLLSGAIKGLAASLGLLGGGAAAGGISTLGKLFAKGGALGAAAYFGEKGVTAGFDALDRWLGLDTSGRPDGSTSAILGRLFGGGKTSSNTTTSTAPTGADYAAPLSNPLANFINAQDNLRKMQAGAGSLEQTLNDNSDKSVTVNVGGVTVHGAEGAGPAVGAAVGNAVGNSAAGAAKLPPSRIAGGGGF